MLFDTIRNRTLDDDTCFLCGCSLTSTVRADEHVIPRWAQDRFDLWNQELVLLNRSSIPYRNLVVPCCYACNNRCLQPLEGAVASATLAGAEAVRCLDKLTLFTWLGKIFYGLIHRELFLLLNRRNPDDGTITSPELIEQFSLHHLFLQNVRTPMVFKGDFPATIFIYETKVPPDRRFAWDFRDNLQSMFVSLRVGSVGITAVLQDGGAQETMRPRFEQMTARPLHPLQHLEVGAMVCYRALLATRVPKYIVVDGSPITVVQAPLGGFSEQPLFDDWQPEGYAKVLAQFTGLPLCDVYASERGTLTWLRGPDGSPKDLGLGECPWPPLSLQTG